MGKRIDYDGYIALYHRINKQRSLDVHESDRLDELLRKKANALAQRKYREKHAPVLDEKKRTWYERNKKKAMKTMALYRENNRAKMREIDKRYKQKVKERLDNPTSSGSDDE